MKTNRIGLTLISLTTIATLLLWLAEESTGSSHTGTPVKASSPAAMVPADEQPLVRSIITSPLAEKLHASNTTPYADLIVLYKMLGYYCLGNQGQLPIGTNQEITQALVRPDAMGMAYIAAEHPAINAAGELTDRWQTPYLFHARSSQKIEIRSAGPDRILFNSDDRLWPEPRPASPRPLGAISSEINIRPHYSNSG